MAILNLETVISKLEKFISYLETVISEKEMVILNLETFISYLETVISKKEIDNITKKEAVLYSLFIHLYKYLFTIL